MFYFVSSLSISVSDVLYNNIIVSERVKKFLDDDDDEEGERRKRKRQSQVCWKLVRL